MSLDTANALVTVDEAKTYLKISAVTEDSVIENLVNRASTWANDYTGRLLKSRVNTEYYDGDGTGTLQLKQYPVTTLTSLYDDPARAFGAGTAINVTNDVILNGDTGTITLFNAAVAFNVGTMNVKAVYTAGYVTVPESLKEAVLLYIGSAYRREYVDQRFGITSETVGDRTTTYATADVPPKARILLDKYVSNRVLFGGF